MAIRILYFFRFKYPWVVEPLLDLMANEYALQSPGLQNTIRKMSKLLTHEGK